MNDAPSHTPSRRRPRRGLLDLDPDALSSVLVSWGEQPYRGKQVLAWAYERGATSYDEMSNVSKALRLRLSDELPVFQAEELDRRRAKDGTVKLLLGWRDGATSECVLIPEGGRRTACVSTQVGCGVRCVFCASGIGGLQRQLTTGEIVEQAMRVRSLCEEGERLSNVVFMGLGEPLANYNATVGALRTINAEWGMGIGARKITVSTVGLPKQIRELAREGLQVTLALSLHAPTDELRERLVPWAKTVTIEALTEAVRDYFAQTGREVTIEYVLLGGVNDSVDQARRLVTIARRMRANVNLIPYNPVAGLVYRQPEDEAVALFADMLSGRGVTVQVRKSRGRDVDAACGQLRRRRQGR